MPAPAAAAGQVRWGKILDQEKCIGCHACTVACKAEHQVPLGVTRTYVKQVEVGAYPNVRRHFQVTRCNQCTDAPCVAICPVGAMFRRRDGIVDFDREACIGCKACMAACPYDAIYMDPVSHSAEKCNFCAHRIDQGLEPACVSVCPERAIVVGDLNDPESDVARYLGREKLAVRRPEKGTRPGVFYHDASEYTLSPTAAGPAPFRAAQALVAYDLPPGAPWGWKVSLYTWTKSIAAGAYLLPALWVLLGGALPPAWGTGALLLAGAFLALTGALLVWDLHHPARFLRILLRPRWQSWLARGAWAITGYSLVALATGLAHLRGNGGAVAAMAWPGIPLAALSAMYTAWLFAQSRGRDLWQNPVLPLHLLTQAVLAGAAALTLLTLAAPVPAPLGAVLRGALAWSAAAHLALGLGEALVPHATRDGARAARALTRGAFRVYYWGGLLLGGALPPALAAAGAAAPLGALGALAGLLAYEHAYVQAGQSVPQS